MPGIIYLIAYKIQFLLPCKLFSPFRINGLKDQQSISRIDHFTKNVTRVTEMNLYSLQKPLRPITSKNVNDIISYLIVSLPLIIRILSSKNVIAYITYDRLNIFAIREWVL